MLAHVCCLGLYGHSAVYHQESRAIYVYGGYEYQTDKSVVSDHLYSVTVDNNNRYWSLLPPEVGNRVSIYSLVSLLSA